MFNLNYYNIVRAANILDCEIDDVINLWLNNYIYLYIELKGVNTKLERYIQNNEIANLRHAWGDNAYAAINKESSIHFFSTEEVIESKEVDNGKIILYKNKGIAFGLWRIIPTIATFFVNDKLFLFNYYNKNKLKYFCSAGSIVGNYYEETGYDYIVNDEIIEVSKKDLVILKEDFLIIKNNKGDFQRKDNYKDNQLEHIKPPKPVHPTVERHAVNREKILIAAIRFQREQPNVLNEQCFKKNGDINYSAFARALIERSHLFPDGYSPVRTIEPIISVLKSAYEPRHEKK